MQLNALKTEHLPANGFLDWLAANQLTLTIIGLALLALLLLVIAVRLFRHASQPGLRKFNPRAALQRTPRDVPHSDITGWTLTDITGQVINIFPLPFTIGRGAGNTLVLDDPSVAIRHAIILNDPIWDSLTIEDLDSASGIQIDGQPTHQNLLQPGMHLTIGRYTFAINQPAQRSNP
jgi:hypothetical protein